MKKNFTSLLLMMVAFICFPTQSIAGAPGTYKTFTETTVFLPTVDAVAAAVEDGWIVGGTVSVKKKGNVDPTTGEIVPEQNYDGVNVKKGGESKGKIFKAYVTGVESVVVYGVTTSGTDTRIMTVTATPTEGEAVVASEESAPKVTAVVTLSLDKTKMYEIDFTGVEVGSDGGADISLYGVKFVVGTTTGISEIQMNKVNGNDVYSINGTLVRKSGESLSGLSKGLYIMGGKKVIIK